MRETESLEQEAEANSNRQERQRIDGLRILARIIARHYLANSPHVPQGHRRRMALQTAPEGGRGMKRRQPSSRVKLRPDRVWELLNRLNITQNELASGGRHLVGLPLPADERHALPVG